ncbi:aminotransferase class V-fold PLP-dependent enzyme [Paenibacillus eucommiae]|uniref:Selenocysteine lyase/cysteine desulfurase n=1 Tax=Paenibacillus eucommiae TaxID=1355755 RepID=A0ABS4J4S5_9BACL|nr:aminotransferase class V-fold PLP-dependent enzyme [Paenibacillus eucommiae]MBP1994837.1 selenocysteine lyase/cysteine desulfurase [Paenibacillus eucommiae]
MKPLIDKNQFLGLENCTWLFNGAETPPHQVVVDAFNDYINARAKGPEGREHNAAIETSCRAQVAQLLHGRPEDIAFMSNASEAISMIAQSLNLKAGDNIVINTLEFPSGVLPWLLLEEKGVEIRRVEHQNWQISVEDVLQAVDEHTKLVMTSHVSFISGARFDYRKLYSELKQTNALLLLDVTQSLGVIPVHMYEADFVVCSSYKWLLSVHGLGLLGINKERVEKFTPRAVGWRSVSDLFNPNRFHSFQLFDDARKFELGYPSFPTIYSLNATSALLLEIGIEKIEQHVLALGQLLIDELQKLGHQVLTPLQGDQRAGNISFAYDPAEEKAEQLKREKVYVWGGDHRLRASVHLFNDESDIQRFVSLLSQK